MKERTRFAFAMIERSEFFCLEPDYLLFTSYLRVSSRIDRSEHHGRLAEQAAGFSGSGELAAAVLVGAPAGARGHRPAPPALPRRPRSLRLRLPPLAPRRDAVLAVAARPASGAPVAQLPRRLLPKPARRRAALAAARGVRRLLRLLAVVRGRTTRAQAQQP